MMYVGTGARRVVRCTMRIVYRACLKYDLCLAIYYVCTQDET